jgi:integrase
MAGTVRKRVWRTRQGEIKTNWTAYYRDQQGQRHNKAFAMKRDAEAWLLRARSEVRDGIHTPERDSPRIAEAAIIWLRRCEDEHLERATLRSYELYVRTHIVPLLGEVRLSQLTTPSVAAYRDELLRTRSRYVAQRALTLLKMLIREMERRGLVKHNAASPVRLATKSREKKRLVVGRDVPTKEEVRELIEHIPARWRPWLVTAVSTGMRISELLGLTWDCIDFDKKIVHVRKRVDRWATLGPPKTEAGMRDIPISEGVARTLKEWQLACPHPAESQLQLVFPNDRGGVMRICNLDQKVYRALQISRGIVNGAGGAKYGLHKLRHFFASWAIEQQFPAKRLQEILGHSSITMTYDRYGHWFPAPQDDQARVTAGERAVFGTLL